MNNKVLSFINLQITNNGLIVMECFQWLKKKTKGKRGCVAIKLFMLKAYDRIEWDFVKVMLFLMGFPKGFINVIMKCVSTVSYQILIIGKLSRAFSSGKGLSQGNPLSPYLFILCANVLSGLISKEVSLHNINGLKVARNACIISHLFFMDDNVLFARANSREVEVVMNVLKRYQESSGKIVNLEKTEVSFSKNVAGEKYVSCLGYDRLQTILITWVC